MMAVVWGSVGAPVSEELSFLRKKVKLFIYGGVCAELPGTVCLSRLVW